MNPETAVALGCQALWPLEISVPTGMVLGPFWLSLLKFLWRLGSSQKSATILLLHFLLSTVTHALSSQFTSRSFFFLSTLNALRAIPKKKVQLGKFSGDQQLAVSDLQTLHQRLRVRLEPVCSLQKGAVGNTVVP